MTKAFVRQARLMIAFAGYWLSGTGTGRGRHLDEVTYRDRDDLPAMPMTQVKGQLRESAERLASGTQAGWSDDLVVQLFGSRTDPESQTSAETIRGALAFRGEARLSAAARAHLGNNARQRQTLFRRIAATKIDDRGAAEDRTLRAVEAVVPLTLEGEVEWIGAEAPDFDWIELLDAAAAATLAFGKLKADGYGRAIVTLADMAHGRVS